MILYVECLSWTQTIAFTLLCHFSFLQNFSTFSVIIFSRISLCSFDLQVSGSSIESRNSILCGSRIGCGGTDIEEKIDSLVHLQFRSNFYTVEHGLISLLKRCLGLEKGKLSCVISGHVNHFQSLESEDLGWGCGWRNIQMLSSYLLKERDEVKSILFGGVGFVPDIPSLQRWLEIAWEMGFDVTGSETFNKKIYGMKKWIGTTECAALFRSFGLRARVVDFGSKSLEEAVRDHTDGKRKNGPVYGPMDKFLCPRSSNSLKTNSTYEKHTEPEASSLGTHYNSSCSKSKRMNGHHLIAEWVWNYFSEKVSARTDETGNVLVSEKT